MRKCYFVRDALVDLLSKPFKLAGLRKWGGLCRKGVGEGPHIDGRATGHIPEEMIPKGETCVDVCKRDRTVAVDRNSKGKEKARFIDALVMLGIAGGCTTVKVHDGGSSTKSE